MFHALIVQILQAELSHTGHAMAIHNGTKECTKRTSFADAPSAMRMMIN